MESLMRLCLRLDHSTPNGYCPLSLRGRRLGVRLVIAVVPQPTSSRGRRSRGRNLIIVAIMRQSVTQGSGGCKVGFGRFGRRSSVCSRIVAFFNVIQRNVYLILLDRPF